MKGFTVGRKARIATISKSLPKEFEIHLLAGLLDTDGGKKANSFGFTTASKELAKFCKEVFSKLGISFHETIWQYKYWDYYQIYVKKCEAYKILENIPIQNKEKIGFIKSLGSFK